MTGPKSSKEYAKIRRNLEKIIGPIQVTLVRDDKLITKWGGVKRNGSIELTQINKDEQGPHIDANICKK